VEVHDWQKRDRNLSSLAEKSAIVASRAFPIQNCNVAASPFAVQKIPARAPLRQIFDCERVYVELPLQRLQRRHH
jgi:hypothetical protein